MNPQLKNSAPREMYYLNHAGTSWPKPKVVRDAVASAFEYDSETSLAQANKDHEDLAARLGVNKDQLLLSPGCTSALQLAVSELPWSGGDRVLLCPYAHWSLERPVRALAPLGVKVDVMPADIKSGGIDLAEVERQLHKGAVRLLAVSAASSLTGVIQPLAEIEQLARRFGCLLLVDAAQLAGWFDFMSHGDLIAFGSHKGFQGPWGIGGLYAQPHVRRRTYRPEGPIDGPTWCDVGSLDRAALAGLLAGIRWLDADEQIDRLVRARSWVHKFIEYAQHLSALRLLGPLEAELRVPTVAFTMDGWSSPELGQALSRRGLKVGAGMLCAPLAHATLGTQSSNGVVRVSFGPSGSEEAVDTLFRSLCALLGGGRTTS